LRSNVDLLVIDVRVVDRRDVVTADGGERTRAARGGRLGSIAVLALGAALLAGVIALTASPSGPARSGGPQVVARVAPGGGLTQVVAGFGSAWVLDNGDDLLLRMDPATRRVTARIALRAGIGVDLGDDAVWVGEGVNDLLRIDPQSNRVVARIALERGAFSGGAPIVIGDAVWVVGSERALRVDAGTGHVTRAIALARSGDEVRGALRLGGDLLAVSAGGRVLRVDGRTGELKTAFRVPFSGVPAIFGGSLYLADRSGLARVDPRTGRTLWRTRIDRIGPVAAARGLLWAEAPGRAGDRIVAVDPRSGRTASTVRVGEFGVLSMQRVGSELWMATAGGDVVAVRP
jgi:streptogramin lyase